MQPPPTGPSFPASPGQPPQQVQAGPQGHVPAFQAAPKAPGGTACKVWGVLLLVFALFGIINGISVALAGLGVTTVPSGSFGGMPPAVQKEMERLTEELIQRSLSRWSFWANGALEVVLALLSVFAGLALLRSRPVAAKAAAVRALAAIFLFVPINGIESFVVAHETTAMMNVMFDAMGTAAAPSPASPVAANTQPGAHESPTGPAANEPAAATAPGATSQPAPPPGPPPDVMETMETVTRAATYGGVIFTLFVVLVINGILLFQMTRPHIAEYLKQAAEEAEHIIPGLDASMGLMPGAPPPGADRR